MFKHLLSSRSKSGQQGESFWRNRVASGHVSSLHPPHSWTSQLSAALWFCAEFLKSDWTVGMTTGEVGGSSQGEEKWREGKTECADWIMRCLQGLFLDYFAPLDFAHTTGAIGWKRHPDKGWKWCWLYLEKYYLVKKRTARMSACRHCTVYVTYLEYTYSSMPMQSLPLWLMSRPDSIGHTWT